MIYTREASVQVQQQQRKMFKMFLGINIKQLMTGPKESSELLLVSPRPSRLKGKQNSLFPVGPVIECFVKPTNSKIEKQLQRNCLLEASWLAKFAAVERSMT